MFDYYKYYTEGRNFSLSGKNVYDNPYPYGSKKHQAWTDGFYAKRR